MRIEPIHGTGLSLALFWLISALPAVAHESHSGMRYQTYKDRYGQSCCNEQDCRPATAFIETTVQGKAVVRLLIEGTWITVARSYVVANHATDGRAHFCGRLHQGGAASADVKPEPTCVILPPRDT